MGIRLADVSDVSAVMALIRSCVSLMDSQGIHQWDELYPDRATFAGDIVRQELFVLERDGQLAGIIVLNEHQEPAYREVPWEHSGTALVVHRLAVDPAFQGRGYGRELMRFAHEFAERRQYATIRLDAFASNPGAVALYERLGYRKAGTVRFRKGLFYCFEIRVD